MFRNSGMEELLQWTERATDSFPDGNSMAVQLPGKLPTICDSVFTSGNLSYKQTNKTESHCIHKNILGLKIC